ncbi:hypothetical protein HOP52_09870 [Halomonas campisalis]|uniref:DUF2125 domain-containing protein n=1 Tax=Billgrantia campisalis TaxID=74661 RepID=A0ABS9P8U9_9GAMM|nr:hypothetical protein [Halomonas campisalis]MCG6658061.1 hypothetical protein [Halomonas campisalis]MDR5862727.1 hypothetical protein [Halomonas campisalis]
MTIATCSRPARAGSTLALAALLGVSGSALADAERLEADLRAMFGGYGSVELGEVSSAMVRSRVTAEGFVFEAEEGERLLIDRYVVSGDYDSPDEVTLEGVRIEDRLTDLTLMSAERIVLGEPSRAVFPFDDSLAPEDFRLGSLAIDDIVVDLASEIAEDLFYGTPFTASEGRLTIDSLRGESLSHDAIGMLEITGVAGAGENLDELGSGSFTLASLRVEGLSGLDGDEERLDSLVMRDFAVESDRLVGSLSRLAIDGDFSDGEGGLRLEDFSLDLAKMIELAPESERTQLRMVSNVLTDGSGTLRLDAAFLGNWEEGSDHSRIHSDSHITAHDAVRLLFDIDLPLLLPEGAEPADVFADTGLLDAATLLGGDIRLTIGNEGLFGRLATLGAAMEGVTEAQYIEQTRTQAEGFGMMFGPQVQAILMGLVELLEGNASELEINVGLPAESNLATYTGDPLGLPDKVSFDVETR